MRQFTCPKAITHPSTNRARCRATALIETNALPLHQTDREVWDGHIYIFPVSSFFGMLCIKNGWFFTRVIQKRGTKGAFCETYCTINLLTPEHKTGDKTQLPYNHYHLQWVWKRVIQLTESSLVATSITVVWCTEDCYNVTLMWPVVALFTCHTDAVHENKIMKLMLQPTALNKMKRKYYKTLWFCRSDFQKICCILILCIFGSLTLWQLVLLFHKWVYEHRYPIFHAASDKY